VVFFLYVLAGRSPHGPGEHLLRKLMIRMNAVTNTLLLVVLGLTVPGIAIGGINFAASFPETARLKGYQRILGWTSWLMPMSWPVTVLGAYVLVLDLAGAVLTLNRISRFHVERVWVDRPSGCVVLEGGWLYRPGFRGGFNLGNFAFITPGVTHVVRHEAGHTLNVAAFGSVFHFVGAIDENIVNRHAPYDAYAERLAESARDPERDGVVRVWA